MTTIETGWRAAARPRSGLATAVRRTGWAMVGVGVVLAGFVVYELFVTSFFAQRAQAGLTAELDGRIAAAPAQLVPYDRGSLDLVASPVAVPDDLPLPAPSDIATALESSAGRAAAMAAAPPADADAPAAPAEQPSAPPGSLVAEPPAPPGNAIGRIEIPVIGLDWTVVEGVGRADLRTGAGHMPDTAMPGQPGNAVISGHRTTYGAPFHELGDVHKGDLITVTTATGSHVYQVVDKRVVLPNETWVTGQWEGSWLTLTTCHPKFSSQQRLIVFARLVGGPNAATLVGSA